MLNKLLSIVFMVQIENSYISTLLRVASTVTNGQDEGWSFEEIPKEPFECYVCGDRISVHAYTFEEVIENGTRTYEFHKECRTSLLQ